MRGSPYYQVRLLVDEIFCPGAKKYERIDQNHPNYKKVSSYQTMASYRAVWESFFHYLREHWKIKNAELITGDHVAAYIDYKIEYFSSIKYLQKISSAMGKLEFTLKKFTLRVYGKAGNYDFSIRQKIIDETRNLELIASNYHNRAYEFPHLLIASLTVTSHRLAATIQYEGGARIEGVGLIKPDQLHGIQFDPITGTDKGIVFTKEKGGKEGSVFVSTTTYNRLLRHFQSNKHFKIDRQAYSADIRNTCRHHKMPEEGSHGLRWNFAKRRMMEYAKAGYTYEQSLQAVSWEMKHNRASITEHYLG
jgi:integrase